MDLAQRLNQLESVRDWQGLAEELGAGHRRRRPTPPTKAALPPAARARARGEVPPGRQGAQALPGRVQAEPGAARGARQARAIYWDLGKINMVQKLLELRAEEQPRRSRPRPSSSSSSATSSATSATTRRRRRRTRSALGVSGGASEDARACLEDVQVDESTWQAHVGAHPRAGREALDGAERARGSICARRASRKRFAPGDVEGCSRKAYAADSVEQAGGGAVRAAARRGGSSRRRSSRRSARSSTALARRGPRARSRSASACAGRRGTRTSSSARSSSRRRSSTIPTTRPRSPTSASSGAPSRATGSASRRSPRRPPDDERRELRSWSRRRARSRGVSSAT